MPNRISKTGRVVNISGYKFVKLENLESLQADLKKWAGQAQLKGTILLSEEGINCFLAGSRAGMDSFLAALRSHGPLEDFEAKESFNDYQPFSRMLVKIKKEIITFDVPAVEPAYGDGKKIAAEELKAWLDEGRDVVLLDTRNDYEIELGTFDNAESVHIDNFREFPEAIRSLPEEYRKKPLVMFCTGGIRCEKAGPFMEDAGFENVLQLEGGILKYFEKCGGAHWQGECFVFDKRVALDPELSETATTLCYVCQAVLKESDQLQPGYRFGVSCPKCYTESAPAEPIVIDRESRQKQIAAATSPLPGSIPYENFRPMTVSKEMDGLGLLDFFKALKTHLAEDDWLQAVKAGHILHRGKPVGLDRRVMHGQKYYHLLPDTTEPDVATGIGILHEDRDLVVIEKPAPLPMHPCGRYNRNSLQSFLYDVYAPDRLRLVHRLDANTSGVVLYARSKKLATALQEQFGQGRVEKEYLAGVHGNAPPTMLSDKRIAAQPGPGGIRFLDPQGQQARTEFETVCSADGQSLLKARPMTGRTNQIRIHLWELGFPIQGDPTYLPQKELGVNQTNSLAAAPMQLHASRISFDHPDTGETLCFQSSPPEWLASFDGNSRQSGPNGPRD